MDSFQEKQHKNHIIMTRVGNFHNNRHKNNIVQHVTESVFMYFCPHNYTAVCGLPELPLSPSTLWFLLLRLCTNGRSLYMTFRLARQVKSEMW